MSSDEAIITLLDSVDNYPLMGCTIPSVIDTREMMRSKAAIELMPYYVSSYGIKQSAERAVEAADALMAELERTYKSPVRIQDPRDTSASD